MFKNETLEIKPLMNGYKVSYDYRVKNDDKDSLGTYDYVSEEYSFKSWDEVVDFVKGKQLETPPAKM